jgi:hypothetical protein
LKIFATVLCLLLIATCPHAFAQSSPDQQPTTMTDKMLAVYQLSGGFAGMNQTMTVYKDGKLEMAAPGRKYYGQTSVGSEKIAKLRDLISKSEYSNLQLEYPASRGADLLTYRISTWASDGKVRTVATMDTAIIPDILSQVISELDALRGLIPAKTNSR